jgi:hypothetical protein
LWLIERFENLHPAAGEAERFARVWLWHFLGSFLFLDVSGNTISWIFVDIRHWGRDYIAGFSWDSAVLAWTYR